jgi:hypothetical protein
MLLKVETLDEPVETTCQCLAFATAEGTANQPVRSFVVVQALRTASRTLDEDMGMYHYKLIMAQSTKPGRSTSRDRPKLYVVEITGGAGVSNPAAVVPQAGPLAGRVADQRYWDVAEAYGIIDEANFDEDDEDEMEM